MKAPRTTLLLALLLSWSAGACDVTDLVDDNTAPVADAGDDQSVYVGETVDLNGWGSSDDDGDALTYAWTMAVKPDTSDAVLADANTDTPSFVPDVPGTYRIELEVSDGDDTATDEVVITASWDLRLTSLSSDTTLTDRGEPYIVPGDLYITGAVTIAPGVTIQMAQGGSIWVESGGSLTAVGTATDSIRFVGSSAQAGHWDGLHFETKDADNRLAYVVVAHAGATYGANVRVWLNGQATITNSTMRDGSAYGLRVDEDGTIPGFAANAFRNVTSGSVLLHAEHMGSLDAATTYTVPVELDGGATAGVQTWKAIDAPYMVTGRVSVASAVTVQAGAVFEFDQGVGLWVEGTGSLNAVGTATDVIRFLGSDDLAGHWEGVHFETVSSANELTYVEVANGGETYESNVRVWWNGQAKITNSLLRDGSGYGLLVEGDATIPGFAANTFDGFVDGAVLLHAEHMGMLDAATVYGATSVVELAYGTTEGVQTWKAIDAEYLVSGRVSIATAVTVQPGAVFRFAQGHGLWVEGTGSLAAVGTAEDTIRFTGADHAAGHWEGIHFETVNTANELTFVEVADGGETYNGNVRIWWNGQAKVTESRLHNGSGYGFSVEKDGRIAAFTSNEMTGNALAAAEIEPEHIAKLDAASTYSGNTVDVVIVNGGAVGAAGAGTWPALDVPYRVTGRISVDRPVVVAAGADFRFEQSHGLWVEGTGTFKAVGTATDRITFLGTNAVSAFWEGIHFRTKSADNVLNYVDVGHGGDTYDADVYVWWNGSATVTNSLIHDAPIGLYVDQTGGGILSQSGNTFTNVTTSVFVD